MNEKYIKEKLYGLSDDNIDDFRDEILTLITQYDINLSNKEKNALLKFSRSHFNPDLISSVLIVASRIDPQSTKQLMTKFFNYDLESERELKRQSDLEVKSEVSEPKIRTFSGIDSDRKSPIKTQIPIQNKNLLKRLNDLSKDIKESYIDDFLSILSRDEVKKMVLSPQEKSDILQLIKGHYSPAALFNALQVITRLIEESKWLPGEIILRKNNHNLRFGVELVPAMALDKIVDYSRKFEMGGIDTIWITDHYNNLDPYITLTLIAKATSAAYLGVGVTNPYVRHFSATAQSIASLEMISNGRMMLGIGAGDKSTLAALNIGPRKALTRIKETISAIRALWTNDVVNFDGTLIKLKNARFNFRPERNIPIYVGAQGPKMLQLAGEIGDGVLINASHPLDFGIARKMIELGVNRANRKMKDIDITAYTSFSVADNKADAFKAAIPVVAFIAAATPSQVLERHDLKVEIAQQIKDRLSKGDFSGGFSLINEKYLETFAIGGTPEVCISKIDELKKAGVTQFVFGSPLGPKKKHAIELIVDKILSVYN